MPTTTTTTAEFPITRKIFKYEILCAKKTESDTVPFPYLNELLNEIHVNLSAYTYDNAATNKWYGFDTVTPIDSRWQIILANCKYNYRPNLIDISNRSERVSPKHNNEGDKEKTHVMIQSNNVIYEQRRNGTGAFIFCKLLNTAWKNIKNTYDNTITSIVFEQIIDNNFLEIIRNANKIKNLKVVAQSNLVGSDYLNFCDDTGVQDNYTIEIKAKKHNAFNKTTFIQRIERLLAEGTQIEKITVGLNDDENNPRVINSDEFAQQYIIYADKNDNGEVVSEDIFKKMAELL